MQKLNLCSIVCGTVIKRTLLVFVLGSTILSGCSKSVKETMVTEDNEEKIFEQIKDSKDLTVEEVGLLQSYMMRHSLADVMSGKKASIPTGKTIGQMIEEEKLNIEEDKKQRADAKLKAEEEKARIAQAKAEAEKQRQKLLSALTVTLYEKDFTVGEYIKQPENIIIKMSYKNLTSKEIRGFKGTVIFKDLFGDTIKATNLKEDQRLGANETRRVERVLNYNMFMPEDKKLLNTKLEDMKVEWQPDTILFADGTSLEVDEVDQASGRSDDSKETAPNVPNFGASASSEDTPSENTSSSNSNRTDTSENDTNAEGTRTEILERYANWQQAWEDRNLKTFLSFYDKNVTVQDAEGGAYGYSTLSSRRRKRWQGERDIQITDAEEPTLEITGNRATLDVTKDYESSLSHYTGQKQMVWENVGGEWLITDEKFTLQEGGRKP